jgi:hypothetical protein
LTAGYANANKITGPNAGGPHQLSIWMSLTARVGQFCRWPAASEQVTPMVKQAIRRFHLVAACISLLAGATSPVESEPSPGEAKLFVRETALGTLPLMVGPSDLGFSPDNLQYSYVIPRPGGRVLCQDGVEGPTYQRITEIQYSSDGRRVAYWAAKGDEVIVVVDGKEGKPYLSAAKDTLAFSPDGQHVVYVAGKNGGELTRVLDGEESRPFSKVHTVRFSPDSRH